MRVSVGVSEWDEGECGCESVGVSECDEGECGCE